MVKVDEEDGVTNDVWLFELTCEASFEAPLILVLANVWPSAALGALMLFVLYRLRYFVEFLKGQHANRLTFAHTPHARHFIWQCMNILIHYLGIIFNLVHYEHDFEILYFTLLLKSLFYLAQIF